MKKLLLLSSLSTFLFAAPAFAALDNLDADMASTSVELFSVDSNSAMISSLQTDASIDVLYQERSVVSVQPVQLNSALISGGTSTMMLNLDGKASTPVTLTDNYWINDKYQAWTGEVQLKSYAKYKGKNPNRAVFVRSGERVFGQITMGNRVFEVMTTEAGAHVLVERDFSQLGVEDDTPALELPVETDKSMNLSGGVAEMAAVTTIRVLQVASTNALNRFGTSNVVDRMNFFIAQSNDVYSNNGIPLRLQDAGKFSSGRTELGSVASTIRALRNSNDGYLDQFAGSVRNQQSADIVAHITDHTGDGTCGQVDAIGGGQNNGFFVSRYTCTGFTFVHELAHLFGSRHDNDGTRTPFSYGHGFVNRGGNFRTIMAVNSNPQPRIGYLSTDDQNFRGGSLGNQSFADNERVHRQRLGPISRYR